MLSGFPKLSMSQVLAILMVCLLVYFFYVYSDSKMMVIDGLDTGHSNGAIPLVSPPIQTQKAAVAVPQAPVQPGNYSSQSVASPQDLLPHDQNSQWSSLNPSGQGNIAAPDLLQAGYHIGLDTIGQTLRNANLQERSDPIIPKSMVGPWNQSTIEPDLGRVPLEVGVGAR